MMATIQVDVRRLQAEFPKEFERAYWEWAEAELNYDWWDCVVDGFIEDMKAKGVRIAYSSGKPPTPNVYFSLSYSQGDYASFEGTVTLHEWFAAVGMAETYPMLAASLKEYGAWARISSHNRGGAYVSDIDYAPDDTAPPKDSMFSDTDPEIWEEVVLAQYEAAGIEKALDDWVQEQCQDLYIALRDEYEYLSSEEQFIERCVDEGTLFDVEVDDEDEEVEPAAIGVAWA
jgi:hypothetical protein